MALGLPVVLDTKTVGSDSITSNSFPVTAGTLLVVVGGARRGAANASAPFSIANSGGLTFTQATELNAENGTSSPSARQAIWTVPITASASGVTVTLQSVNASHVTCVVFEIENGRLQPGRANSDDSNVGDPNVSVSGGATPLGVFAATFTGLPAITVFPGLATLTEVRGTNSTVLVSYNATSSGGSGTWTSDGNRAVGAMLKIDEAQAAATVDFPADLSFTFSAGVSGSRPINETVTSSFTFSGALARTSTPEAPAGVWRGSTRTWDMPSGIDPIAGNNLSFNTLPDPDPGDPNYEWVADIDMYQWNTGSPSLANFLMPVSTVKPDLRSVANGGKVRNANGWDIRFETSGGAKVPHKLMKYDPALGELTALVNAPRNLAANQVLKCYIGNASVTATEEDPAGLRAGGWLAIYAGSGVEFTGQTGRDLVAFGSPAGNVTVGSYPARRFNGTNQYYQSGGAAAWLNGLSEVTVISAHSPDTLTPKMEVFNVASGAAADMSLHFNDTTTDRLTFAIRFGTTVFQYQSANETQGPDYEGQFVAVAAKAGEAIRMAIDGERDTPGSGAIPTAGSTISANNFLEWGRGGRSDLAYWNGDLAVLAFCSVAHPMDVLEAMSFAFSFGGPGLFNEFVATP
jgi:hypothetical protein